VAVAVAKKQVPGPMPRAAEGMIRCPRVVGDENLVALVAPGSLIAVAMADAKVVRVRVVAARRYVVMGILALLVLVLQVPVPVPALGWSPSGDACPGQTGGNQSLSRLVAVLVAVAVAVAVAVVAAAVAAAAVADNHLGEYQSVWDQDLARDSRGSVRNGKQVSSCGCSRRLAGCSAEPEVLGVVPRGVHGRRNVAWPACACARA